MADKQQIEILKQGVEVWNEWRRLNSSLPIDLSGADLSNTNLSKIQLRGANLSNVNFTNSNLSFANLASSNLSGASVFNNRIDKSNMVNYSNDLKEFLLRIVSSANFSHANLTNANLTGANFSLADLSNSKLSHAKLVGAKLNDADLNWATLSEANLQRANFRGTSLFHANLWKSNLSKSELIGADLTGAYLTSADLTGCNLKGATLYYATIVQCILEETILTNCKIFGISAWGILGKPKEQSNLVITPHGEPEITVDDLQVAQFIYLLLNNYTVRNVIDTITSKVVLILGRFTGERKSILDAIRSELRSLNFSPILFDFAKPASKDVTGTVETLARMSRFIIADLTDPSSIPHEIATITPHLRTTPIQLIKQEGATGYSMINDYVGAYKWLLEPYIYKDSKSLIAELQKVVEPANSMAEAIRRQS